MSRLTKKQGDLYYPNNENDIFPDDGSNAIRLLQVIGKYEDLEEELGIDLITLFKALKSGVWYREWKEPIKHTCGLRLLKSGKSCWGLDNKNYYFPLEEYSKTWSLRKEDLEDDK